MHDNQINGYRLKEEHKQIVENVPESIRWAKRNGKLKFAAGTRAGSNRDVQLQRPPLETRPSALLTSRVRSLHKQLTRACSKR